MDVTFAVGPFVGIEKLIKNKTPGERLLDKEGTESNQDKDIPAGDLVIHAGRTSHFSFATGSIKKKSEAETDVAGKITLISINLP